MIFVRIKHSAHCAWRNFLPTKHTEMDFREIKNQAMYKIVFIAMLPTLLVGCPEQGGSSKIDQSSVCIYSSFDEGVKKCKEGQLSYFMPERWGNEQYPLTIASLTCDFTHPVMHTNGGVICVFTKQRWKEGGK